MHGHGKICTFAKTKTKMRPYLKLSIILSAFTALLVSCTGGGSWTAKSPTRADSLRQAIFDIPMKEYTVGIKTYNVADIDDSLCIYQESVDKDSCFFVISKREYRLYVYQVAGGDTLLAAHFPVCYAMYPEAKEKSGDMRTPECTMDNPFVITEIVDASSWCHDFGDGRGNIPSYGAWFMRLKTGFSGVGIHGSTNNRPSVPGRDSEGCIRLRDEDLLLLHDLYAQVGTPVVVRSISARKDAFETKAQEALGEKYRAPREGNPLFTSLSSETTESTSE